VKYLSDERTEAWVLNEAGIEAPRMGGGKVVPALRVTGSPRLT